MAVAKALTGADAAFVAMGSIGIEANLQRTVIQAAASVPGFQQLVRLSVLNAGPDSVGINQRCHWGIDLAAQAAGIPYTTIRPSIFSVSMLAGAPEIKKTRTWTGLADSGRVALSDTRDVADVIVRVLGDPATWGQHHELTGPRQVSWPEALEVLSAELGETVTFRTADAFGLVQRLVKAGFPAGMAELLVTREWAIMAGENERTTTTVRDLTRPRAAHHRGIPARKPRLIPLTRRITAFRCAWHGRRHECGYADRTGRRSHARCSLPSVRSS